MAYFSNGGDLWGALTNVLGPAAEWAGNKGTQFGNWAMEGDNGLGLLAGAGTGMGVLGQAMGAMQASDRSRQLERFARRPMPQANLDVSQFYQPMSQAATDAYTRQLKAEMQGYGVPMTGAYAANATAEGLAKTEAQRMADAQRLALQKYSADMGQGQNQRYLQLQALQGRPGMPVLGDTSALGNFLRYRAANQARQRGQQQPGATWQTANYGVGPDDATAMGEQPGMVYPPSLAGFAGNGQMPNGIPPSDYNSVAPQTASFGLYGQDSEFF